VKFIRAAREDPPVYLAAVGMSQHGKTTYIQSMAVIMEEMEKVAADTYIDYLDDYTSSELRTIREMVGTQTVTESTQKKSAQDDRLNPLMFTLAHFLERGKKPVVIYDLAGEIFSDRAEIGLYADPLKLAHTVWFFVSLYDLQHENREYSTIMDLFNIYVAGMERIGAATQNRHLHVIYTKADKLVNILPETIRAYLRADPYSELPDKKPSELRDVQFDPAAYIKETEDISTTLYEFTREEVPRGRAFISMVNDTGMSLSFSITSSTGRETSPRDNTMTRYRAFRVIDPMIWALRENKPLTAESLAGLGRGSPGQGPGSGVREIALILDAGYRSDFIYTNKLPGHFFQALSLLGDVKTFHMGQLETVTEAGREPTSERPLHAAPAIIGPVLDRLQENAYVLVITRQDILDLADFDTSDWHSRMGFVTFQMTDAWPRVAVYSLTRDDHETQAKEIVQRFFMESL
jgi:hypothetical protein